jgi:dTDP-glucose 4,6-dehydratase
MGFIFVTGGAGFIGGNFILHCLENDLGPIVNLDILSYAGNLQTLASVEARRDYTFVKGDIRDARLVGEIFAKYQPRAIVHFAAESHVDRSIMGPDAFLKTNIDGTFTLLEAARTYLDTLSGEEKKRFRFLHVSTDEVYGLRA